MDNGIAPSAPRTEIATFTDEVSTERVLVVERFDREQVAATPTSPEWIVRLPQEDFCQATGTPGRSRYESDGGPGIRRSLELLAAGGNAPGDALLFARAQLAFWLLAAIDGHARNFSIFLRRDGYVMTPFYDVLSAWPVIGHGPNLLAIQVAELAMGLRGKRLHRRLGEISVRHWRRLATETGATNAFQSMLEMVEHADVALESVQSLLPSGFPEPLWTSVERGVLQQRHDFLQMVAAGESSTV